MKNKRAPGLRSTLDIPYRIGKVGARKSFPRKRIIKAPYLYDIQENHTRQVLPWDSFIITFLDAENTTKDFIKEVNCSLHIHTAAVAGKSTYQNH